MLRYCTYSSGFAGISPQRLGFNPGPVYVGFVVNKVTMVQVFLRALPCPPVSIIPLILGTRISYTYHRHDVILATVGIVKLHTNNFKERVGLMTFRHLKMAVETTFEAPYHIISQFLSTRYILRDIHTASHHQLCFAVLLLTEHRRQAETNIRFLSWKFRFCPFHRISNSVEFILDLENSSVVFNYIGSISVNSLSFYMTCLHSESYQRPKQVPMTHYKISNGNSHCAELHQLFTPVAV